MCRFLKSILYTDVSMDEVIAKYFSKDDVIVRERVADVSSENGIFARVYTHKLPTIELRVDIVLAKHFAEDYDSASITVKAGSRAWLRLVLTGQIDEEEVVGLIVRARQLGIDTV